MTFSGHPRALTVIAEHFAQVQEGHGADSRRLVHTVLASHEVALPVVQEVLHQGQGNPLALILFTYAVLEQMQASAPSVVPETIAAALLQGVERLSAAARKLIDASAVLDSA